MCLTQSEASSQQSNRLVRDTNQPILSEHLFFHGNEVCIRHQGEDYRLRRTRNGKLILTK